VTIGVTIFNLSHLTPSFHSFLPLLHSSIGVCLLQSPKGIIPIIDALGFFPPFFYYYFLLFYLLLLLLLLLILSVSAVGHEIWIKKFHLWVFPTLLFFPSFYRFLLLGGTIVGKFRFFSSGSE